METRNTLPLPFDGDMNHRRHRSLAVFFSEEQLSLVVVRGLGREVLMADSYDRYLHPYLSLICILLGFLEYSDMSVKLMMEVSVVLKPRKR